MIKCGWCGDTKFILGPFGESQEECPNCKRVEVTSWLEKQVLIQQIKSKIESTIDRISVWQKGAEENFQQAEVLYRNPKTRLKSWGLRQFAWELVDRANDNLSSLARYERQLQVTINWYLKSLE